MAFLRELARGGTAAGMERPLGIRLSGTGGESDGCVLSGALHSVPLAEHGDGVCCQLGGSYALGGPGRLLGGAADGNVSNGLDALAAFCWTTCGFFLVHLAHPWGYTTGCWMPWAWGLGFSMIAGAGVAAKPAYPILLALVLALQLLPGHFQLAFHHAMRAGADGGLGGG